MTELLRHARWTCFLPGCGVSRVCLGSGLGLEVMIQVEWQVFAAKPVSSKASFVLIPSV